jgi:hypothetical protein
MKKMVAVALLCTFALGARADELADGMKAWEQRDFARAQQIYSRLANAGNVQAQLLLGELYGFGEGVPEDLATAEKWISKAQAGGNPDAAASLASMRERAARKADIARYVSGYDGTEVRLAKFGCVKPAFPEESRSKADIRKVEAGTNAWRACYERFAANLAAQMPPGKAIPEGVASLMSLEELDRARATMDRAYAQAGNEAGAEAKAILADYDSWYARTEKLGLAMEKKTKDDSLRRQMDLDRTGERARAAGWVSMPVR